MTRQDESGLITQKCVPCEGGVCPLRLEEVGSLMPQIPGWILIKKAGRPNEIVRHYDFPNWNAAAAYASRLGAIAEQEGHHPDVKLEYGYVGVSLKTHAIGGLSTNDFILAAKAEEAYKSTTK